MRGEALEVLKPGSFVLFAFTNGRATKCFKNAVPFAVRIASRRCEEWRSAARTRRDVSARQMSLVAPVSHFACLPRRCRATFAGKARDRTDYLTLPGRSHCSSLNNDAN